MPGETATAVAYVGAFVGIVGGAVALFNSIKANIWKRNEFANNFIRELNTNQELVFASRALDWNGGKLVVPESLRPLMDGDSKAIRHQRDLFERALEPDLTIEELESDPRIQLYRTAIDSLLSWLSLLSSALERKLFTAREVEEAGYWVAKLSSDSAAASFLLAFGYQPIIDRLTRRFAAESTLYSSWFSSSPKPN